MCTRLKFIILKKYIHICNIIYILQHFINWNLHEDTNNRTLSHWMHFQDNIHVKRKYNCILKSSSNRNTFSNRTLNWIIRNRQVPSSFNPTTFRQTRNTITSMFLFHLSNWSWMGLQRNGKRCLLSVGVHRQKMELKSGLLVMLDAFTNYFPTSSSFVDV